MFELNRIQVDSFKIEEALSIEELEIQKSSIEKNLIKMEQVFRNFQKINISEKKKELFLNGVKLKGFEAFKDGTYNIYVSNKYLGTGIIQNGRLKRDIIL